MDKKAQVFHKIKSLLGYSIAIVVIVVALGVSSLRLLLTTANLYQTEVEELASSLLEQPVKIGSMDAKLTGLVPTLIFNNVEFISEVEKKTLFVFSRIDVGVSFKALIQQQEIIPEQLTIRGMNLHITRELDGDIKIKGVDLDGLSNSVAGDSRTTSFLERWLIQQSEIALEDSTILWKDNQTAGLPWLFKDVNLLLKNSIEHHQLSLSSNLPSALGDKIELEVDFEGDITKPATWEGKMFVKSNQLNLSPLRKYIKNKKFNINHGVVDLLLWADLDKQKIKQVSGKINLYDFSYQFENKKSTKLNYVSALFDSYQDINNTWSVSVDNFKYKNNTKNWDESKFSLVFDYDNEKIENLYVKADYLKLGELTQIAIDNNLVNAKVKGRLNHLKISGDVRNFYIEWVENKPHKIKADFSKLEVNAWKNFPEVKGLSGKLLFSDQNGTVSISSKNAVVGLPRIFRKDFKLNKINADINFVNTRAGMLFDVKKLKAENDHIRTTSYAKMWIPKNDDSPYLDFQTYVLDGDASKTPHYLPVSIMDKGLVNWLEKGIVSGKVNKGTIVFSGQLKDFPFNNNEGVFYADMNASNVTINYLAGWPKIENAEIRGSLTGQGMNVNLLTGNVEKNIIYDSKAEIKSFSNAALKLDISTKGSIENTVQYLVNSPILSNANKVVDAMSFIGSVKSNVKINVPLSKEAKKTQSLTYSGLASIENGSLFMLNNKFDITDSYGDVTFTEKGVFSEKILANIMGEKEYLSITTLKNHKSIKVSVSGKINPGDILQRFDIPGANKIIGRTSFKGDLTFPLKSKNNYPVLQLNSNLVGIKSDYPDFLFKSENTKQKTKFEMVLGKNKTQYELVLGNIGSTIFETVYSEKGMYIKKGAISISNEKAVLPNKNVLYIDGSIKEFTPSKWSNIFNKEKKSKVPASFNNPVILNLDELTINSDKGEANKKKLTISNPKNIPPIEGIIKKLKLNDSTFGRIDFRVSPTKSGMHFDEIILSSKNMKLDAFGNWDFSRGKHVTNMDVTVNSKNLGGMLTDLGYAGIIDKGKAQMLGKINWDAAPTQFSLSKLGGNVLLNVENGSVNNIDAGAGRLLGLFSLTALPRKLLGDFKDSFEAGFGFDEAKGKINFDSGNAYLDDFEITSSVAKIRVSGRAGLVARDFENTVEVIPEVGGGIAGITALLVNLPAGIGLWLFDKITGEKFNEASTRIYEVSGSWSDPIIELVKEDRF